MPISAPPQGAVLRHRRRVEWPTVLLAGLIYAGWLALTLWWRAIPLWVLMPAAAWVVAWHGSLRHEVLHGHPTRLRWLNDAIGFPPLALWLPYARYRSEHLQHHCDARLTDPLDDPESCYRTDEEWQRLPRVGRALVAVQGTLLGRLLIGPLWVVPAFLLREARALRASPGLRRMWLLHLFGVAAVVAWLEFAASMPLWFYLLVFVYPGTALTLLRSFAEHRARLTVSHRTAIVECGPLFSLLFLYNNLHAVHHARPGVAWYMLPRLYRANRDAVLAGNGGLLYRGYGEICRRFLWRRHDSPVHPFGRAP